MAPPVAAALRVPAAQVASLAPVALPDHRGAEEPAASRGAADRQRTPGPGGSTKQPSAAAVRMGASASTSLTLQPSKEMVA
jgi:hypothetical protein